MTPFRMTVMAPGGRLGVLFLAFAASYLSAGWAKRRYVPARHVAKHRRAVTA
jgi:hypothetical protein